MRLDVDVNLLALEKGLRAAYWCQEYGSPGPLRRLADARGLRVSEALPRLVYNPRMTDEATLARAFGTPRDERLVGRLFGYPAPAELAGRYRVRWLVRRPGTAHEFARLFSFQMEEPQVGKLVAMKRRWNRALAPAGFYTDFELRHRERSAGADA